MANREALRELQARLNDRLAAAREQARPSGWLAVECSGLGLLLPLAHAGEIFPAAGWQPVPHAADWFRGVTSLRGRLLGVIDLAAFLRMGPASPAARSGAKLVSLNPRLGVNCAVLVDRLLGLRADGATGEPLAVSQARPAFAGALRRDAEGREWQELDLAALANDPRFLSIAERGGPHA